MNLLELKELVKRAIPGWEVTIDEAQMVNITLDDMNRCEGFAYIEEFATWNVSERMGTRATYRHEITFLRFCDFECDAMQRVAIREERIMPAVRSIQRALKEYGVTNFDCDVYPRGFDANEVLVHIAFNVEESIC